MLTGSSKAASDLKQIGGLPTGLHSVAPEAPLRQP
jgi:hypothetical protein